MKVSIIMGSKSDWDVMSAACFALALFFSPVFLAILWLHSILPIKNKKWADDLSAHSGMEVACFYNFDSQ